MNAYVQIFIVFIFPIIIWKLGLIEAKFRSWALIIMSLVAAYFIRMEQWSWEKLGISTDNLSESFLVYLLFILGSIAILLLIAKLLGRKFVLYPWALANTLFGATIGSILQEFLYRAYLMPKLYELTSSLFFVVVANAAIFTLAHVIFPEIKINLPLIFLAGIAFSVIYWFYPNLIWISFSHMILNYLSGNFGLVTLNPEPYKIQNQLQQNI